MFRNVGGRIGLSWPTCPLVGRSWSDSIAKYLFSRTMLLSDVECYLCCLRLRLHFLDPSLEQLFASWLAGRVPWRPGVSDTRAFRMPWGLCCWCSTVVAVCVFAVFPHVKWMRAWVGINELSAPLIRNYCKPFCCWGRFVCFATLVVLGLGLSNRR